MSKDTPTLNKKKKFTMPHSYVTIAVIIFFCAVLTWLIPAGSFDRVMDEELGREVVVPGSFHFLEDSPATLWGFFQSFYRGMLDASDIIFFVLFASSYIFMLMKTGAINALVGAVLRKLGNRDHFLIPIFMFLFALLGSTFGMYEEVYGLIPAFIIIAVTLGYDKLVGGAIVFVGIATGFAAATINPFTVGLASSIAEVPLATGPVLAFRILCFICFTSLSSWYVMRYAAKIRRDPTRSILYGSEDASHMVGDVSSREEVMQLQFTAKQKISLLGLLALMGVIGYTVIQLGFYLQELSALFLIWMLATGILNRMSSREIADLFVEAVEASMYGVLIIGLARAIPVLLTDANVIDTAVYYISNLIDGLPKQLSAIGMLTAQNVINFFVPSGTGQAVITMPLMTPLADILGLDRYIAIMAYHFGDGFSNMFWPTGVAVECGIIGIGMDKWYKFITPLFLMMFCLECIMLILALAVGI